MSLFKKPKKAIQRRVFTENDDDEEEPMEIQTIVQPSKDSKKSDKSRNKTPKIAPLSFETEEEGPVFQVKKSSHSKKIMKMFEKERRKKETKDKEKEESSKMKEQKTEIVTDDLIVVINSSHKKPPTPPPPILSGRDALCAGKDDLSSEEEEENQVSHRFSKPSNMQKVLESGAIPDAAMIHAARKKRQRAREQGDFIAVEEEEPVDNGRLLRDDDHDASDDERIDMDVNHTLRDQERRREQFLAAQESENEVDDWEDQQIRKGVTGAASVITQEFINNSHPETVQHTVVQVPVIDPGIPRTPQMIYNKLKEHYQDIQTSYEANQRKVETINEDIGVIAQELEALKTRAPQAATKFRFYQELRGYITDLVECFDEKVGVISSLEQRAMDLMAKRSEWLIERRRQDVRDQAEEASSKGMPRKVPEDEEKVRRAAEREGRRTRRRRVREVAGVPKHVEGMSSDEEIPQQDLLTFEREREQIESEAQAVFEDVVDDYSSVANILIKFEQWRETDISAYNEAYATLCLPKIVNPLVRLNMIFWDPLTESVDLEKLDWYRTLAMFGLHDDETEVTLAKDPDINLLPVIVEKVVIVKLTQLVDRCWDPLSSSQTLRLVGAICRYIKRYPTLGPACKSLNNLFNAILHKIKSSLEYDVFIPITPKLGDSKSPFFQRQFTSGLKLLKNITSWQGVLNDNTLKELALVALLNRYLLSAVKFCMLTDAISKVSLISLILPRVWLQSKTPELQMFKNHVLNLHQQLDRNNPLHLEPIESVNNILKTIRANNQ